MTRVLVVSPQTMISMSLQHEYDVVAVAPEDLSPMVVERGYDVTVLDAADPQATLGLMSELPREHTGPFLLLAHDQACAEALDAAKGLADIRIGPPVSGASLRDTLHGIAQSQSVTPAEVVAPSAELQPAPAEITLPAPKADVPAGLRHNQGELGRRLQGRAPERPTLERAGTPADLLALAQGLPTLPAQATQAAETPAERPSHRDAPSPAQRAPTTRQKLSTVNLVTTLLDRVSDLLGVTVIAAAVAEDACARVSAQASAVILADEDCYVVAGGAGLRPLEARLQLDASHWLIREVVLAKHGVIVEDTDIARRDLAGAPLGAQQHLLAVPLVDADGLVLVARGNEGVAFTSTELAAIARLASEASGPLREAVQVRQLGRALAQLDEQ